MELFQILIKLSALDQKNKLDSVYKPIEPDLLYLNESDWKFALSSRNVLQFSPFPQTPSRVYYKL